MLTGPSFVAISAIHHCCSGCALITALPVPCSLPLASYQILFSEPTVSLVSHQLLPLGAPWADKDSIQLPTRIIHMSLSSSESQKGNRYSDFMVMKTPKNP